uniref:Uncharacterized protein n=1 Tax=Rhizophora mucronata TaxID=61149 RepID=A0A2P2NJQ8_RHIMU
MFCAIQIKYDHYIYYTISFRNLPSSNHYEFHQSRYDLFQPAITYLLQFE